MNKSVAQQEQPAELMMNNDSEGAFQLSSKMDTVASAFGTSSDDNDIAMTSYEQENYVAALVAFEKTLAKDPENYNALFYSAVSYLGEGQADKAVVNLEKVLLKKEGEFYDAAKWYISLAYIKQQDRKNARKNLLEIKNNSKSKYQRRAVETLKEMEE